MSDLVQSGLSFLIPKDNRLTLTLLVAGTGALALLIDYYYRDKLNNGSSKALLPQVNSKIDSGNARLEEAIRFYESALVDMQRAGADSSQRMQIRAMLLRAYEIQAILSPDEFNLRSSVMIEGSASDVIKEIVRDNISEIDAGLRSNCSTPQEIEIERLQPLSLPPPLTTPPPLTSPHTLTTPPPLTSPSNDVSSATPLNDLSRVRSNSMSSDDMSDFYEAFDVLEEDGENSIPPFYRDQIFLHKHKEFSCRTNRFQQFKLTSPSEYLVKVQCIRLALDRLMKCPEKRSWMVSVGRINTCKLLSVAGTDTSAFCTAYDEMMEYVGNLGNMPAVKKELGARRVACINLFDIVIDFCLLDSFDDLDMPPAAVTSVLSNSWISQSLRKSMLSTAVWGMISSKSKKTSPGGFLGRFYTIMGELSPSLAWGFLGDDTLLRPICALVRSELEASLTTIFDEQQTDYTTLDNLSEDLYKTLKLSSDRLEMQLDRALIRDNAH